MKVEERERERGGGGGGEGEMILCSKFKYTLLTDILAVST